MDTHSPTLENSQRRTVGISTLGCKVNLYESKLIAQNLKHDDWHSVTARKKADVYVINTCSVTHQADLSARKEVRRVIRQNPDALVVVTGCYAQLNPHACAQIPGVDLVIGNDGKLDIHQLLPLFIKGELPKVNVGDLNQQVSLPNELLSNFEGQTRAFMQIQQGCDQDCTFCVIHKARGPGRSIPMTFIKRQAQRLIMNGYKELVICGVDLGSYGKDIKHAEYSLASLINELHEQSPQTRLRLSSIDPVHITDELIDQFKRTHLCAHLHLSLQSANTLILKRMKRRYVRELVYERINSLRSVVPDLVISADIMTGFPTETDECFSQTLQAISDLEIAYPHVFPYSQRPGTPAVKIPDQVDVVIRKKRSEIVRLAGRQVLEKTLDKFVGQSLQVLTEKSIDTQSGLRMSRAENYLSVLVHESHAANQVLSIVAKQHTGGSLIAKSNLKELN